MFSIGLILFNRSEKAVEPNNFLPSTAYQMVQNSLYGRTIRRSLNFNPDYQADPKLIIHVQSK